MVDFKILENKKAVIFELDDVLFPAKDYLLQVYYLFAQFMEYTEQKNAQEILAFMQQVYVNQGPEEVFEQTAAQFDLPLKYKDNFNLLHQNARLPLKLLLFDNMLQLLKYSVEKEIKIFIITDKNPAEQLNKIKQMEWNDLGKYLTVFFAQELEKSKSEVFINVLNSCALSAQEVLFVGANKIDEGFAKSVKMSYIASNKVYN